MVTFLEGILDTDPVTLRPDPKQLGKTFSESADLEK